MNTNLIMLHLGVCRNLGEKNTTLPSQVWYKAARFKQTMVLPCAFIRYVWSPLKKKKTLTWYIPEHNRPQAPGQRKWAKPRRYGNGRRLWFRDLLKGTRPAPGAPWGYRMREIGGACGMLRQYRQYCVYFNGLGLFSVPSQKERQRNMQTEGHFFSHTHSDGHISVSAATHFKAMSDS